MTNTEATANVADSIRIAANIEIWKRKLLDVTKRNKALNFKPAKVSTVVVTDEQPAEVFRHLVADGETFRFRPKSETSRGVAANKASELQTEVDQANSVDDDEGVVDLDGVDFTPYDISNVDERHRDEFLQTSLSQESLDKSLRRLDEQARLSEDEQGVSTLFLALGMLRYTESADSDQVFRAPLVLVPAQLSRKSARAEYELSRGTDDVILNPALVEHLRNEFGIRLPDLSESLATPETFELQSLFAEISSQIARQKGWSVQIDIVLALFSFQKFAMYKDLEASASDLAAHRVIRQLITRHSENGSSESFGLPREISKMDLDDEYPSETTFQVVDADSSQLRAIAAVSRQHDLVIEGPPGTGKSQTITNLIAQSLSVGKSVLFVAEKMAALSVVQSRLVSAGLGEFCLELHSNKANKRAVAQSVSAALDASTQQVVSRTGASNRLPLVRQNLTDYVRCLHEPFGAIGISPYSAFGAFHAVKDAPRVTISSNAVDMSRKDLDDGLRALSEFEVSARSVGSLKSNPWRDSKRTFYSPDDLIDLKALITGLVEKIAVLAQLAADVPVTMGLPPVATLKDIDTVTVLAEIISQSPGASADVLRSDAWNAPPESALQLIAQGEILSDQFAKLSLRLNAESFERNHDDDIGYVKVKSEGLFSFLAFLDGRYRSINRRWNTYRTGAFHGSMIDQVELMESVGKWRDLKAQLSAQASAGMALFGRLWKGPDSNWTVLKNYVAWVVRFRNACVEHGLSERAVEAASRESPDMSHVQLLQREATEFRGLLEQLAKELEWPSAYLDDTSITDLALRMRELSESVAGASAWGQFELARKTVDETKAREMLAPLMGESIPRESAAAAFVRAFWAKWLSQCINSRPLLERFSTVSHENRVEEFRRLDAAVLTENRASLVSKLRQETQHRLREDDARTQLGVLRKEFARQRGHAPLRITLKKAGKAVQAIKPCWLMSPLTVAQYLSRTTTTFDLVIFDEASQLPVEDAVGSVLRGKQLVVVGDPKQLPPSNFFAASIGQIDAPKDEFGMPIYEDSESILEEVMASGTPMSRLKWHYRSAHESLINFSNVSFYDSELYTFPSTESGSQQGLQFCFVEGGVYEGKGLNSIEARRVADEVVRFAQEQIERKRRGEPTETLGVGTFNLRQQVAVQDELEVRRRRDPSIESFFDRNNSEPFFVKNLENIQGDERDCIILSVTYARASDGKLRYNFGPLNGENGWRRLNVLITRARKRMLVFSSIRADDISTAATSSRGADLLRQFLGYAEHGRIDSPIVSAAAETESPFEREVLLELATRGYDVVPQVGVSGYRIDLAIRHSENPGRFICGIECDGVAYHNSETARDRDRLRQQVLEKRGWNIVRVWSTDWFKDRAGQITRLVQHIERAKEVSKTHRDAEASVLTTVDVLDVLDELSPDASFVCDSEDSFDALDDYVRPVAKLYSCAPIDGRFAKDDLLAAPASQIISAINSVVHHEGPIHEIDLYSRVASGWNSRLGSSIQTRIQTAVAGMERRRVLVRKGAFVWRTETVATPRDRKEVRTPADRIPPEEYEEAILTILKTGHSLSRTHLTNEVRAMLGFARTGAQLDSAIGSAIDRLVAGREIGEAAAGLKLTASQSL